MLESPPQHTVNLRIILLIDHFEKGNKSAFGRRVDMKSGVIGDLVGGRLNKPSYDALVKILSAYPAVSPNWLILGRGSMLQDITAITAPTPIVIDNETYFLAPEQWRLVKAILAELKHPALIEAEAEILSHVYHFGNERTPGIDYDDRFSMRTGIRGDDLQEFINTPEEFNQLRHTKVGNRMIVTERAIREWFGDIPRLTHP